MTREMLFLFIDLKSRRDERWLCAKLPDYSAYRRRVCHLSLDLRRSHRDRLRRETVELSAREVREQGAEEQQGRHPQEE